MKYAIFHTLVITYPHRPQSKGVMKWTLIAVIQFLNVLIQIHKNT